MSEDDVLNSITGFSLFERLQSAKRRLIADKIILDKKDIHKYPISKPPFNIPSYWYWCYLSAVSIIQEGPGIRKHQYTKQGIQFLTVTNILEGEVDLENSKKYISIAEFNKTYKHFTINKGDVVTACSGGSWGKSAIFDKQETLILNTSTLRLRFFEDIGNNRYLYYLTKMQYFKDCLSRHTTGQQPNYGYYHYSRIPVPLAPPSEQLRIVSILDEAFAAIAKSKGNAEQNLKNTKELFESYLQMVFNKNGEGWVSGTIGDICNLMTGGTPSTSKKEYYEAGKIKWLVSGDINQKEIFDCESRITQLGLQNSNARILPINSVLIALNGQGKTRGTVAMLRTNATCNQSLVSIYPKDVTKVLPELIYANLDGRYNEIRKLTGDSGNDRRGLNMPIIRKIKISFPNSIEHQKAIVHQITALRTQAQKLQNIYQKKIECLEELKKSILQKAFSGQLSESGFSKLKYKQDLNATML